MKAAQPVRPLQGRLGAYPFGIPRGGSDSTIQGLGELQGDEGYPRLNVLEIGFVEALALLLEHTNLRLNPLLFQDFYASPITKVLFVSVANFPSRIVSSV